MLVRPRAAAWTLPYTLLFSSACCAQSSTSNTLTDVLSQNANLSSFQSLLTDQFPQLLQTLETFNADNQITVLAPSNHAFDSIVYSDVLKAAFASNASTDLDNLVSYHVLPGNWNSETLNSSFQFLPTMTSGSNISAVTGGQRVGAVLQGGEPREIVFTSAAGTRSVATTKDIPFVGG